jgi:hypothetical protein
MQWIIDESVIAKEAVHATGHDRRSAGIFLLTRCSALPLAHITATGVPAHPTWLADLTLQSLSEKRQVHLMKTYVPAGDLLAVSGNFFRKGSGRGGILTVYERVHTRFPWPGQR